MCHVFVRADSLIGVCLSDQEYPKMVAHKLLTKVSANYVIFSVDYILKTKAYPNKFEIMRQSKSWIVLFKPKISSYYIRLYLCTKIGD